MSHDHEIPGHDWFDGGVGAQDLTAPTIVVADQEAISGSAFSYTPTASDAGTMTFSLYAGTLPGTMTINSATGEISGVATILATYSGIRILVVDDAGNSTISDAFSITVITVPALSELVYNASAFVGSIDIDGTTYTAGHATNLNSIVYRTYGDGTPQWAAHISSESLVQPWQVEVDRSTGDVYVALFHRVHVSFDPALTVKNADGTTGATLDNFHEGHSGTEYYDAIVVVKYDPTGVVTWAERVVDFDGTRVPNYSSNGYMDSMVLDADGGRLKICAIYPTIWQSNESITISPGHANAYQRELSHGSVGGPSNNEQGGGLNPMWFDISTTDGKRLSTGFSQMYGGNAGAYAQHRTPGYTFAGYPRHNMSGGTMTPLGKHGACLVKVGAALNSAWMETAEVDPVHNASAYTIKFLVRDDDNTPHAQLGCWPTLDPSTATTLSDSVRGMMMVALPGSEEFLAVTCFDAFDTNTRDRIVWSSDAESIFTKDTEDNYTNLTSTGVLAIARVNAACTSTTWRRTLNFGGSGSPYRVDSVAIDETNGKFYVSGTMNSSMSMRPEWDGLTFGAYPQSTGSGIRSVLIKFDLATGGTDWWVWNDIRSENVEMTTVMLTDEHVLLSALTDAANNDVGTGSCFNNSNLDGNRAAQFTAGVTLGERTLLAAYSKSAGQLESLATLSSTDATAKLVRGQTVTPRSSTYAVEAAAPADLIPGHPVWGIEAVGANGFITFSGSGQIYGDGDNTVIGAKGPVAVNGGTLDISATGGPGGGSSPSNILANAGYFGSTSQSSGYREATSSLAQPGIVLMCLRATDLTRPALFSGQTSSWDITLNGSGYLGLNAGTLLTATGTAITAGQWFWVAVKVDGNNSEIACSVAQSASGAAGANSLDDVRFMLDASSLNGMIGRANCGKVWDGVGEWTNVKAYAAARWTTL